MSTIKTICDNAHTDSGVNLSNTNMLFSDTDNDTNSTLQCNSIESASETSEELYQVTTRSDKEDDIC